MLYKISAIVFFILFKILFKLEIKGRKCLPKDQPFILAANHLSNLDPLVVGVAAYPQKIHFMAKEELFSNKISSFIYRQLGVMPLKRSSTDISALRMALKTLKTGSIGIFPQGTRSLNFEKVSSGVAFLQKKAKVPIIAAKIYGTDKALPKGAKFFKKEKVKIVFGKVDNIENSNTYDEIVLKVVNKIKNL
ncbi:MAG: 1-acyl-sn-glycerol-3-phosphate acyltransferase [Candidatus Omnitrophica bacterium]|nr:1-acyl-sn-glycerol-3-phosphate acyltransferase [Candidatus Omnitrophota bacterium]MCK5491757.1 1-acyl-sn-glycerol-3-phosphate acyltransferase [Candidatus Omnitrophota bacterium]